MPNTRTLSLPVFKDVVKRNGLRTVALIALVTTVFNTSVAFADSDSFTQKEVKVTFSLAELGSSAGLEKVYTKLEDRAAKFCKADRYTLHVTGETIEECVFDLLDQFVVSADVDALTTYHEKAKLSPSKYS